MEIRKDLEAVAPYIARLISIGEEFRAFDKDWSHLKNKEDFRLISRIPHEKRHKVEAVYADGRDMTIFMYDALLSLNGDFSRYPTLTSIVEAFKNTWVYGNYDTEVPNVAQSVCAEHNIDLWSIKQMILLFRRQEQLLSVVRGTLQILQNSDLYKMENGIPIMDKATNIQVSGNTGSSININSSAATASVTVNYNEPTIFAEMISRVKSSGLDIDTEQLLIDNVQALAASHRSGGFKEAYKDFMQNMSAHITIFSPFIANLAALL